MNRHLVLALIVLLAAGCGSKKGIEQAQITLLESPAQSPSAEPHLFTDEKGSVYLSWVENKDGFAELKFSRLNDNKWSRAYPIASGKNWFVNWADYPMVAGNGNSLIAHYLDRNGDSKYGYDVKFTLSPDEGQTWTQPVILHDDGKQAEHGFISYLPYGENFLVAWLDGRNTVMEGMENHEGHHGQMSLRAAVVNKDGLKLNEWELDNRTCDCCQTSLAMTATGPVAVYRDRSNDEIRDMAIVRLVNGTWTEPKPVYADNWKIAGCPVNGPRIAAHANTLAVAWFSSPDGKAQVNVIFSHDGGETFGSPVRVDEGNPIGRVDIVLADDNTAFVSWMEATDVKLVKAFSDGRKDQSLTIAASSSSRSSGFPQMTQSGNKLYFAWTADQEKVVKTAFITL